MVSVLKQLKVWTLYGHIVAQVNHRGLGVTVETETTHQTRPNQSAQSELAEEFRMQSAPKIGRTTRTETTQSGTYSMA